MGLKTIRRAMWCLGLAGALLGSALVLLPQPVQAQSKEQVATVRKAIDAAYKAEDAAFINYDLEGSLQSHATNYVYTTKEGKKISRAQLQEYLAQMFKVAEDIQSNTAIENLAVYGNRARVRVKTYARMHLQGQGKSTHILAGTERRDDVWVKQGDIWLRTQGKEVSSHITLDGKPLPRNKWSQ